MNTTESNVTPSSICIPSDDVVARIIEGEIIIVPLVSGIGNTEDELYTLNATGQVIWEKLDGQKTLSEVAAMLASEYNSPLAEVEQDVLGFAAELTRRGILIVKT